jgi:hypothetical protein
VIPKNRDAVVTGALPSLVVTLPSKFTTPEPVASGATVSSVIV